MADWITDVRKFRAAQGNAPALRPTPPPAHRIDLCENLITEQLDKVFRAIARDDLVGLADGVVDSIYVLIFTAQEYGIPLQKVWDEVQRANMDKVLDLGAQSAVRYRDDGKVLHPDGWTPPDVKRIIDTAQQEW